MTRCKMCRHGINEVDAESGKPFVICTLIPPTPLIKPGEENMIWARPTMAAHGWCGQAQFSLRKFFFRGPRT
jgi:hypothetical protein